MRIVLSAIQEHKVMKSPLFVGGVEFLTAVVLAVPVRGLIIWFMAGPRSTKALV